MSHNTLENSMIVSGNNSIWSEKEREEIIDCALEIYLSKRRITTLSSEADSVTKLTMNTMKMTWTVFKDERLVDELMVFNVDNDTSDVSDADE